MTDAAFVRRPLPGFCRTLLFAASLLAALAVATSARGQDFGGPVAPSNPAVGDAAAAPGADPAAAADAVPGGVIDPNQLPPHPGGFWRGNGPGQQVGFYFALPLLALVLGAFFLWVATTAWADQDATSLKVRPEFWSTLLMLGGILGMGAIICLPNLLMGVVGYLVFAGGPLTAYIVERNARVPDSGKVMTKRHLSKVLNQWLNKVGMGLPTGGGKTEQTFGPPITFMGKSSTGNKYSTASARKVESSKGYVAAKELIYDAILRRSTDVHLEPQEEEMSVRVRVDGAMYPAEPFDRPTGEGIVNIFKVLSAMDITEKRRPQDGSFRADLDGRMIDFRIATAGTRHGEKMSLRILDQSNAVSSLQRLGMRKGLRERLEELINEPHGMVLCSGPTGAGKSTTLYASLNAIDKLQRNVITIEDPVEYQMDGINQIEINTKAGQTFAGTLRSVLRQDPDVVLLGEIRDKETAEIACQAANTGHMVFSTVHANDSITALFRLIELGVEPFMISNSLTAIVGQRLVRRLCEQCKQAYQPKPELVKKAGLPVDKIEAFYRPPRAESGACPKCGGLGYMGRVGVYEVLEINDRIRDLIRDKAAASQIRAEARKNGMLNMREEGLRLVVRGVTSIEELLKVVK
ncbi:GspE/PulE family protein [Alienimonas californiensis]|uniref:Type II secretion system protein E n=1 Tax=Alienimonas californiensis TaxID=2527989 RepID=A0A517PEC6_9PLAN|nr:GspE/PulE family protein [Alienimonas californiensis]QDT17701.1 Type II secretion system protein E [Alienimonas californiensis]